MPHSELSKLKIESARILHTVAGLSIYGGGPTVSVPSICRHLRSLPEGWKVTILTTAGTAQRPTVEIKDIPILQIPAGLWPWQAVREAKTKIVDFAPSLVHDQGQWLPMNHASALAAGQLKVPRIVSPRGMLSPWSRNHHRWKKRLAWWLYARQDMQSADVIHATSELERDELRAMGCRNPIAVIPNGVEISPLSNAAKRVPPYALFLSRLHPKKGLRELVETWRKVRPAGWRLVIAGPDPLNLAAKYKIVGEPGIEYLGMIRGSPKNRLLEEASLFILPSYSENFGIAVAEALMARTPAIATHGTPWKIIADTHCGWWIEMNEESLADTLREATAKPAAELRRMGEIGRQVMIDRFSWERVAEQMSLVYRWLVQAGPRPPSVETID